MTDQEALISTFAASAARLVPHHFDVIKALDDGTPIPVEALSEDHTIGIYGDVAPRKMREHIGGYQPLATSDLRPQSTASLTPTGSRHDLFFEYVPLRGVRFRSEELQYLEDGWWASLEEVKYPAFTVLSLAHLVGEALGQVHVYLNSGLPMPLWIRSQPIGTDVGLLQVAIQARAGDRMRPTNIHTECPMGYARRWITAARGYYDLVSEEN